MSKEKLSEMLLNLLFPPRCLLCGEIIPIKGGCPACRESFLRLRLEDEDCGLGILEEQSGGLLDGVCASFLYEEPISEAVARFKFRGESWLAVDFAQYMARDFARCFPEADCALALGAPSSERRRDHAARLAAAVAKLLGLPGDNRALAKIRRTAKQHELGSAERRTNLKGAFKVKSPEKVRGKSVLLV
ncbi:MAG: double zinc ribbon domain-containing protein, partial [Oscillospiraceae bacterium]|nr:double zinc ribbon domain-containing protein [Oscillospiraceae bacterium]